MTHPLAYLIFVGGAADKEPFLWESIKLPFIDSWTHHSVGLLANLFNKELSHKLNLLTAKSKRNAQTISKYYKIDYLSYTDIFFEQIKQIDPTQDRLMEFDDERYQKIKQYIGEQTKVYIIGHSLGGWNGAHLSHILSKINIEVDCLITLDPVGTGNHELSLINPFMRKAQIYANEPIPIANHWINIQAFHIDVANKRLNGKFEDWVAWAGGQWIIDKNYPTVTHQLFEKTELSHKEVIKMFTYQTSRNQSAQKYLLKLVINRIKESF